jgi:DNA (cytosine-5)-methyltransferase 1
MGNKLRLLDLFCAAGGASMGYHRAGFEVVGVDNKPQKRYPFEFHQADAMTFPLDDFDVLHASPPCQKYSTTRPLCKSEMVDLVADVRAIFKASNKQFVIENVYGAPLINPMMLCGTMFDGLRIIRHRYFETNFLDGFAPASCHHAGRTQPSSRVGRRHTPRLKDYKYLTITGHDFAAGDGRIAMGIDWMTRDELSQAIPPAYTEWIGRQLMEYLKFYMPDV